MVNKKFEAYKISREIRRNGLKCIFSRKGTNDFGEPTGEAIEVGMANCLYHEQNSHISITTGDTTQTRTQKVPSLLCLAKDILDIEGGLQVGDVVTVDGVSNKVYQVTGVVDIQEWHIILDISLEIVDEGRCI